MCRVFPAPFDVRLTLEQNGKEITTVVQPDLTIVCDENKLDQRGCLGSPDMVVEILSPGNSKKEMKQKYEVYEEARVKEYWLIQPMDKILLRYVLNDEEKYIGLPPISEDDTVSPTIFPDMNVVMMDVFEGVKED